MSRHDACGLPLPNTTCPVCLEPNRCAPAGSGSFDLPCWCSEVEISAEALARIPRRQRGRACLCPRCAAGVDDERAERANP